MAIWSLRGCSSRQSGWLSYGIDTLRSEMMAMLSGTNPPTKTRQSATVRSHRGTESRQNGVIVLDSAVTPTSSGNTGRTVIVRRAGHSARRTLMASYFLVLLDQAGWKDYRTFLARFRKAAEEEAAEFGEPGIARLTVSERTFDRWKAGQHKPQNEARRVLVRLMGVSIAELFEPAPATPVPAPRVPGPEVYNSA